MKSMILGAGKMGIAIGHALISLGHEISIVESNSVNASLFAYRNGECRHYASFPDAPGDVDVVVSSLPYTVNLEAARWAASHGLRYCDLGGSVPVSAAIKEVSRRSDIPMMTDLGLAPGWINIMGEEVCGLTSGVPDKVQMMVGGLPAKLDDRDPLNYMMTWSLDGLLNEYMDDCEVLEDGCAKSVRGMDGLESVQMDGLALEAFYTSGGLSHSLNSMKDRGVRSCCYKTLRYPGHRDLMRYLLSIGKDQVGKLLTHSTSMHTEDVVLMIARAWKGAEKVEKTLKVSAKNGFSAMQRATAFPISAVAHLIACGCLDGINCPSYADIASLSLLKRFNESVNFLMSS